MKDYTIEADVMAHDRRGKDLPDMGIVASRYTLLLDGNNRSCGWCPGTPCRASTRRIDFPWKPGTWYRLKLTVEIKGGKGVASGKVWPRGQAEPDGVDGRDSPIRSRTAKGARPSTATPPASVDGQGPGTEVYYANVKITPNGKK